MLSALRAALVDGGSGSSLYLSGTPGTGKTATVHHALRELAADPKLPPFRTVEINGMKLGAAQQVRAPLREALRPSTPLSAPSHRLPRPPGGEHAAEGGALPNEPE